MRTEDEEQMEVAHWLNHANATWCHVPNGGRRSKREGAKFRAMGVRAGVPDILVFGERSARSWPIAIELKRAKPARSVTSEHQKKWIRELRELGWRCKVCFGAAEAIAFLRANEYRSEIDGD